MNAKQQIDLTRAVLIALTGVALLVWVVWRATEVQ